MLNQRAEQLDVVFHALSDPSRRSIVERLTGGSATVTELAEPLPMSMPAVLQHLQVLEHSGIVRSRKVGRVRECRIDAEALGPAGNWIEARKAGWARRLDQLGDYLAESE